MELCYSCSSLIGGSNDLPLVRNFDPSTWTIPSIIGRVPELVNWHNLPNTNEEAWSLISDSSEDSLLPPLEHVGSPIEPENPQPLEPSTSNLAPSTSFGPPPVLPLGHGAHLIQWFQQMQQTIQPASGPSSPFVSYGRGRGRGSFQPSEGNWPPSGHLTKILMHHFRTTKTIGNSMPLAPGGNPHRDTTLIGPKFCVSMSILKVLE